MREAVTAAAAAVAGAATMYYLDPMTGRRRRALVRDRAVGLSHDAGHYALAQGRRAADHLRGVAARGRSMLWHSAPASDAQLRERIRSRLGRISSRPRAIHVDVDQGCVCLRGMVAADEVGPLLTLVSSMPGVERVDNLLIPEQPTELGEGDRPARHFRAGSVVALVALASLASLVCLARTPAARHAAVSALDRRHLIRHRV